MSLKITNRPDFLNKLKSLGFEKIDQGAHEKWSDGKQTIIVPRKHKIFNVNTHKDILRRAGIK